MKDLMTGRKGQLDQKMMTKSRMTKLRLARRKKAGYELLNQYGNQN
jgi:hypothetical protein